MLNGLHLILTYACNFECDHCFLFCSPQSKGTFTINQLKRVLDEAEKIGSIEWIFYEGGEPMLMYPVLMEGIREARSRGFAVGVVTNAYGAISEADAKLWLKPLADAGVSYLSISNDTFHYGDETDNPATIASTVADKLGINTASICIDKPEVQKTSSVETGKGASVVGGGAKFRGRAVEKLIGDLPVKPWDVFCECPYEDLETPSRVHLDPFGSVHICQGISMGNMWETPLSRLVADYQPKAHPICGPLIEGGPSSLAQAMNVKPEHGYVDECHFCYQIRKEMIEAYPDYLSPRQVYGLE